MGAAIIAGVEAAPVLESGEHVIQSCAGGGRAWCHVVRRSPLEDFKDRAPFASAPDRQPGATRNLDMLSGYPPEIIR